MKTFKEINTVDDNNLMIVDSLNLGFRWMHSGATDFIEDYVNTVNSLARSYKCSKVIIAGDIGSSSYRKALLPKYKVNRKEKYETQTEAEAAKFKAFFEEMQRVLQGYENEGIYPVVRFPGVEADDIAAYIVSKRKKYNNIWLISSDRDWDLLVDSNVSRFSYVTRKEITLDNWKEHYDFSPEDYISIKCLMGDTGDNVAGVPGIGPKRAISLVKEYGSCYDIIANMPIPGKYKYISALNTFGADNLMLNYKLMDLVSYCDAALGEENCKTVENTLNQYLG